eukprot:scaffold70105_cov15-Tisochrysis_lutea.AAC.1
MGVIACLVLQLPVYTNACLRGSLQSFPGARVTTLAGPRKSTRPGTPWGCWAAHDSSDACPAVTPAQHQSIVPVPSFACRTPSKTHT